MRDSVAELEHQSALAALEQLERRGVTVLASGSGHLVALAVPAELLDAAIAAPLLRHRGRLVALLRARGAVTAKGARR